MEVILLEKVTRLGGVGDVANVKDGYARNFLIPQKKALRATKANIADIEARREILEKQSAEAKANAEKAAATLEGLSVKIVRQASEDGKLYGSVNARDVASAVNEAGHNDIERRFINLNEGIKNLGLYQATITLHPEVRVTFDVQVVRTLEASAYDTIEEEKEEIIEAESSEEDAA